MSELLSVQQALERLLAEFSPLDINNIPLVDAAGSVLAANIFASRDMPEFANSSMDGFAVRSSDIVNATPASPVSLAVKGDIPAGTYPDIKLGPGEAARIMTGAPLPVGADCVVPVEQTNIIGRQSGLALPDRVEINLSVHPGDYVRPIGQDVRKGELILSAGTRLRPQEIGLLAMFGVADLPVHRRPVVAVLSTGDELIPVDEPLQPGKIHDTNGYTLLTSLQKIGVSGVNLGIVGDNAQAVQESLDRAVEHNVDLILTSAGVSVGAFDYVRTVLEQNGGLQFWRVNMRPGKPLAFGTYHGIPVFGLPGNPVSAFVGFEIFVLPALEKMRGSKSFNRRFQRAVLLESLESDGRESYLRAVITSGPPGWQAKLTGHQGSGNLRSLVQANAMLLVPSGVKSLPIGAEVEFWFLD
jgi:molybdopterin molybdotransferase